MTHPNAIQSGFLVEVEIDGISFEATVSSKSPKVCRIEPTDPFHHQQRYADYSQIVRVLERPAGEEVAS
jgi:hypothetical protein